jgi:hypothetical protein
VKGPNLPAVHGAQKGKQPGAAVRVGLVKNRQALPVGETDLAKSAHQLRHIAWAKHRLGAKVKRSYVQHRLANAPFPASSGQSCQDSLAGCQIVMTVCAVSDEFSGADDLKFLWHN